MAFKPTRITDNWESRVESTYRASVAMNQGTLVEIDPTDTTGITRSTGFSSLIKGSLRLATIPTGGREMGVVIASVLDGGRPIFPDRILKLPNNYMSVPTGMTAPVYRTLKGDVIGTTEYVGYLSTDTGAPGYLDTTNVANFLAVCGIYQGRFRLLQGGDEPRARFTDVTTQGGIAIANFEIL